MNIQQILRQAGRAASVILLVMLASCIKDDFPVEQSEPLGPGLHLNLQVGGETLAVTRAESEATLREDVIETVDIFIFTADGSLKKNAEGTEDGYVHSENPADGVVMVYSGTDWLEHFEPGETYSVYVLANYEGDADLSEVKTLDDLKAVVAKDEKIVYWEGMTLPEGSGNQKFEGKTFLMDGHTDVTYEQLAVEAEDGKIYELPVKMYRAAVKVKMTINLTSEWDAQFDPSILKVQVSNYATATPAVAEGNPLIPEQRGFQTTPEVAAEGIEEAFSEHFVYQKGANESWAGSTVLFYAYVNRWDDLVENETMLLIDMPGRMGEETLSHNFYKIPIIPNMMEQVLQRNTCYEITATADMLGSTKIDDPVELTDVKFQIADWKTEAVSVGEDEGLKYLILNEYHIDLRNTDGYDGLEFYSSSPIQSVEFVGFRSQAAYEAVKDSIDFTYPGEQQNNEDYIPAKFFINKDGERQEVNDYDRLIQVENQYGYLDWQENLLYHAITVRADEGTEGHIHLESPNPNNVTKRYMTLKVTNTQGLSKYVVVEQYPLEYIQPIQGYYSYRDDFLTPEGVSPEGAVYWGKTYYTNPTTLRVTETQRRRNNRWGNSTYELTSGNIDDISLPVDNYFFYSKVYYNNSCYMYRFNDSESEIDYDDPNWIWTDWEQYTVGRNTYRRRVGTYENYSMTFEATPDGNSGNSNPMMYFVTITQTNNEYNIAHPMTENVSDWNYQLATVSSSENDELVSPSFMLASQLGAVYSSGISGWEEARKHCAYYVETYQKNGEVFVLDDWRLPTSAEIKVIIKYQNDPNTQQVMEEVLGGRYYYVSWSGANNGNGNALVDEGNNEGTFIRCIRDVKPNDAFLQDTNQ
ncbi:MAG TPA: hypothetical protein H9814_08460 [Candidatus Bacteroides merdigallinarum]|uniref:DUF4906 domain-containing protein n=1 Tax=Candidatus Bacteroides merdigallinarum TaxID=2838473 RepID=A0A9D2EA42_9BACE|nr:hypothetical protein [Candidatus Bacteroides merdigallinarum]